MIDAKFGAVSEGSQGPLPLHWYIMRDIVPLVIDSCFMGINDRMASASYAFWAASPKETNSVEHSGTFVRHFELSSVDFAQTLKREI